MQTFSNDGNLFLPAFHIGNFFLEITSYHAIRNKNVDKKIDIKICISNHLISSGKISEVIYALGKDLFLIFSRSVNTMNQRNHLVKESVRPTVLLIMVQRPVSGTQILRLNCLLTFHCPNPTIFSVPKRFFLPYTPNRWAEMNKTSKVNI